MTQNWLIFASILMFRSAQLLVSSTSGSCASIGYSTSCCPLSEGNGCQATDGECYCSSDCHLYGDCCEDAHCPAQPRTCADVGITQCCVDPIGTGYCDVHSRDSVNYTRCSCNASCHERDDCCSDAEQFCKPDSCIGARKYPDCCNRVNPSESACHVPGGNCYCDPLCTLYHDCCNDAETHLTQCTGNGFSFSRTQSAPIDSEHCQPITKNPEQPTTRDPEPVTTGIPSLSCGTSVDVINLTSTITNEDHILWPNEEVVFTCETRGLVLVNNWTSNDYIGDGISLSFNNLELGNVTQSGSRFVANLINVSYKCVMVSQLHIMTSSEFQTSSVACTNFNGTSQKITFSESVLACSRPVPQDGIVIPIIPTSQRNDPITFKCKDGYQPTEEFSTFCLENGTWTIDPNDVCSDIDECSNITTVCPKDSRCVNTDGSYTCTCDEGYYLPDLTNNINKCVDVDECQFGVHICDDSSRANCINTEGSYSCVCKPTTSISDACQIYINIIYTGCAIIYTVSRGGIAPKIKNATIQVKPNHELQYNIGTDFCVEDPMSSKFHSIITCQLEEDALPTPEFLWNITVNGTELNLTLERNFYYENDSLRLIGPIKLDLNSTLSLDIECYA